MTCITSSVPPQLARRTGDECQNAKPVPTVGALRDLRSENALEERGPVQAAGERDRGATGLRIAGEVGLARNDATTQTVGRREHAI